MLDQKNFQGQREHLRIIEEALQQKNMRIWNDWRLDNSTRPDLRGINLQGVDLTGIDFSGATLCDANISFTSLSSTELSGVVLLNANLEETRFIHATIYGGQFAGANLRNANFDGASLNYADLEGCIMTGANLKEVGRPNWRVAGVECKYFYIGRTRHPPIGNLEVGEFEKLYQYHPIIEHIFVDEFTSIDIMIMNKVVDEINAQNDGYELVLDCIHARGRPRAEFTIRDEKNAELVIAKIEAEFNQHKSDFNHQLELANTQADAYLRALSMSIKEPTLLLSNPIFIDNSKVWNEFINDSEWQSDNLAIELRQIREALEKNAGAQAPEDLTDALFEAEKSAKLKDGKAVVEHLKRAGEWALGVSTTLGTNIATDLIKKSLGM